MRRTARRTLGVIIGLALGWYVAGALVPRASSVLAASPHAEESEHKAATPGETPHGETPHHDASAIAAESIATRLDQSWYHSVLYAAVALFAAAAVVGYTGMFRAPASTEDEHDDHAHDDQHH